MSKSRKVTVMEQVRTEKGLTKSDVARSAKMQQSVIGWIESGRFVPYESQIKKIALALDWLGDPYDLLKEVT